MRRLLVHDPPERFVVGTVGEPGSRTFYLQAQSGATVHTLLAEKEQMKVLAERTEMLLDETMDSDPESGIPERTPEPHRDQGPMTVPLEPEFRIGALALGWNRVTKRLIIEAHAVTDEAFEVPDLEEEPEEGPDCLRVRLTGSQARWFVERTLSIVAAGRPDCPFCHGPLDPEGHICPRANGYRR